MNLKGKKQMMSLPETYQFQPAPGSTYAQRKAEIEGSTFIHIRNLVLHIYKKPDGNPLMDYTATLGNREDVRKTVLQFELVNGLIVPDGTEGQSDEAAQPQQSHPPTQQQVPMSNPMPAPIPPAATPAQAVQVAQPTAPQGDVQAAGPTKTKRAYNKSAGNGAAVAPPPAAPPAMPAATPGYVPPQQPPPQTAPVHQQIPFNPGALPPQQVFQPSTQVQQTIPQVSTAQPAGPEKGPTSQEIKLLGDGISEHLDNEFARIGALLDLVKNFQDASVKQLSSEVSSLKNTQLQILTCLHHLYLSHPTLGAGAVEARTLTDFQTYLQKFIGTPQ